MNTASAKNRRIRIALLNILKTEYPGGVDLKVIQFALDSLGYPMPEAMLEAHLNYLEEKHYLRIEIRKGFGYEVDFAALTAKGWDLLDGLLTERGVELP